jgi:hypothetical protein
MVGEGLAKTICWIGDSASAGFLRRLYGKGRACGEMLGFAFVSWIRNLCLVVDLGEALFIVA